MELLYLITIKLYGIAITMAAPFNGKARSWVKGRRNWEQTIKNALQPGERRIMFHCSSLGEFEQGRPLLAALRKELPNHKIILTFFSPSGYTIRQNEPLADYVFYLPLDGPLNSKKFLTITAPEMVFFVKYDFWHYYIKYCKLNKIPVYFISSVFRQSQLYFKWYGVFFNNMLRRVTHFFVQNQSSLELLYNNSIPQVTVTGDTRFDRVFENSLKASALPEIEHLRGTGKMFVAGSTWPADEQHLAKLYSVHKNEFRFIIVPHEVHEQAINKTTSLFPGAIRYSKWDKKSDTRALIIDRIGMLSALYKYADIAYIGGGFGKGIHNILEAAVFGPPILFGPVYKKFREANDLIRWKGAFTYKSFKELDMLVSDLSNDEQRLAKIKEINMNYIAGNKGATDLIINYLKLNHSL